ncbi:MAG: hypothetical protein ACK5JO_07805, partial [Halodesulfovibrio sp.]
MRSRVSRVLKAMGHPAYPRLPNDVDTSLQGCRGIIPLPAGGKKLQNKKYNKTIHLQEFPLLFSAISMLAKMSSS